MVDAVRDPEIEALAAVIAALEPLDHETVQRVFDYVKRRFLDTRVHTPVPMGIRDGVPVRPVSLDDLGLPTYALRSLKMFFESEGMESLTDFRFVPEVCVLKMKGVGYKSLKDFKEALSSIGVVLGSEFVEGTTPVLWKCRLEEYRQQQKAHKQGD